MLHILKNKCPEIKEIVLTTKKNVLYIDLVLYSMVKSLEDWYDKNYQDDKWQTAKRTHVFHLIRFYDRDRFKDHGTINEERYKFLEEVDIYVQMKRDD